MNLTLGCRHVNLRHLYNLVDENEGKKNDAEAAIYEFHVFVLGNVNHACQGLACTWAIRSLKHAKKKKLSKLRDVQAPLKQRGV